MCKGISVDAKIERHIVRIFLSAAYVRQRAHLEAALVRPERMLV